MAKQEIVQGDTFGQAWTKQNANNTEIYTGYALTSRKLDDFGTPDDNTDLDATTSYHGLLPKLGGGTTNFLRADGTWNEPTSSGIITTNTQPTTDTLTTTEVSGTIINNYGQTVENTQTLPAAAAGLNFIAQVATTGNGSFIFTANASDKIYINGTATADGGSHTFDAATLGEFASFFTIQTGDGVYDWACVYPETAVSGYETIYVDAGAMVPTTTNGAASGTNEYATNDIMADYLAFDATTLEKAQFKMIMPEDWDLGTVKAKFVWTSATGSTTADTAEWGIKAGAISDGDAIDAVLGTGVVISDALLADAGADGQLTGATGAMTVGGTPALGDLVVFEAYRNVSGTDDMVEDAWLLGVWIQYKTLTTAPSEW